MKKVKKERVDKSLGQRILDCNTSKLLVDILKIEEHTIEIIYGDSIYHTTTVSYIEELTNNISTFTTSSFALKGFSSINPKKSYLAVLADILNSSEELHNCRLSDYSVKTQKHYLEQVIWLLDNLGNSLISTLKTGEIYEPGP